MGVRPTGTYPDDWDVIANQVKDHADWKCVRCGRLHDPPNGYCLTVHHFDGDKSNCKLYNCMALCQRCHLSVQGRVDPAVPLLFDIVSFWAMPYVAGFYADNIDHPRPVGYELVDWIVTYELHTRNGWPTWAPQHPAMPEVAG